MTELLGQTGRPPAADGTRCDVCGSGRLSLFRTVGFFEETEVNRVELALVQALGRHAAVRAGYSFWAIDATHLGGSEVSARLSGPMLGLDLNF